jgi:hypothetical protein
MMYEIWNCSAEAGLVPSRVAVWAEEEGALVVIKAVDLPALCGKVEADLRADESR